MSGGKLFKSTESHRVSPTTCGGNQTVLESNQAIVVEKLNFAVSVGSNQSKSELFCVHSAW